MLSVSHNGCLFAQDCRLGRRVHIGDGIPVGGPEDGVGNDCLSLKKVDSQNQKKCESNIHSNGGVIMRKRWISYRERAIRKKQAQVLVIPENSLPLSVIQGAVNPCRDKAWRDNQKQG